MHKLNQMKLKPGLGASLAIGRGNDQVNSTAPVARTRQKCRTENHLTAAAAAVSLGAAEVVINNGRSCSTDVRSVSLPNSTRRRPFVTTRRTLLGLYRISDPAPAGIRHFFQIRQKSHRSRIVLPDLKSQFLEC